MTRTIKLAKAGLVLVAAVGTAVVGCNKVKGAKQGAAGAKGASAAGIAGSAAPRSSRAALDLIPDKALIVLGVDVKDTRATPTFGQIMEAVAKDPDSKKGLDDVRAKCDWDPVADLDGVTMGMALPAGAADAAGPPDFVLVLSGGKLGNLSSCVRANKLKDATETARTFTSTSYGGKTIYESKDPDDSGLMEMAAIDDQTLLFSPSKTWIEASIDLAAGKGTPVTKEAGMPELLAEVPTDTGLWVASLLPAQAKAAFKAETGNPAMGEIVDGVKGLYGTIDLHSGLDLTFASLCDTADHADKLKAFVTTGLTMLQGNAAMFAAQMPPGVDLEKILKGLTVGSKGNDVTVAFHMAPADLHSTVAGVLAATKTPG